MSQSFDEIIKDIEDMYLDCDLEDLEPINISQSEVEYVRGDGLTSKYYELPKGATQLRHLIKHKRMEHGIGEAFCALYRLNDNGEYLRNLKKVKSYIDYEIEYEEGK